MIILDFIDNGYGHGKSIKLYYCYYCDNFETSIKQDYESHVILRHPGKLCYPSKADLDIYNGNIFK
jgi:hypothetical protein